MGPRTGLGVLEKTQFRYIVGSPTTTSRNVQQVYTTPIMLSRFQDKNKQLIKQKLPKTGSRVKGNPSSPENEWGHQKCRCSAGIKISPVN